MEVINKLLEKNISKITFALVDKTVPVDQKGELSDIISSTTRPHHFPPGKPVFPGPKFVDLVALWPESGELPRQACWREVLAGVSPAKNVGAGYDVVK